MSCAPAAATCSRCRSCSRPASASPGGSASPGSAWSTSTWTAPSPPESLGDLEEDVALLLGAEKTGASDVLQDLATQTVSVPIDSRVESLNVSVVAGIVLYARSRRRP
ncbi:TrmH family RNA methyltransferase [Curtobacterium sp. MCJR17_043]|uniref:TrmH family RNA methyltransferase n=1 Tax=Curtobacterium sp. MCJR17_043 TaxID=2175660 RepID=UPI0032E86812